MKARVLRIQVAALLAMSALTACSDMRTITIQTYNPAKITFPEEVRNILIVNNSAQQPDNMAHHYVINDKDVASLSISADSTAYDFCQSLGCAIAEELQFDDVRICDDTLRTDSLFYNVVPFTGVDVSAMCNKYGVDAIISLDRFVFKTLCNESSGFRMMLCYIKTDLTGEMRVLWPGQTQALTFTFCDSLKWYLANEEFVPNVDSLQLKPQDVKQSMHYLADHTGNTIRVNFVPYWKDVNRWYYTSYSSEWKRGTAFARASKWAEATKVWEALLAGTAQKRSKARLLSNLALCYEMNSDFDPAVSFAEQSYNLFIENDGADDHYTILQKQYLDALRARAEADKILTKQLHEN
ncbi:MAG: tetratricopeptide repeat protein [Tannerella sp.]|jgi:hypothetical protein|nr:tetratricopeptide repeat protein [Tannerella sp.]